jgi:putative ABC transport system permease protein
MELVSRIRSWWRVLWRRSAFESEMEEEFRFHLERRAEDLMAGGVGRGEAMRRARLEFGSPERYKSEGRDARGLRPFEELRIEVRQVARSLSRSPGFTVAAVLMLGLGIGANAAVFSLISANLIRPLPFPEADRLVVVHQVHAPPGAEPRPLRWSYPQFEALRSELSTVPELAAYYADDVNLAGGVAGPVRVRAEMVSASYLSLLGVRPAVGRDFAPGEDSAPGAQPVVILGHELWSGHFGADSRVVGEAVVLNDVTLTVIGVAPAGFRGLTGDADLWFPQAMAPAVSFPDQLTSQQLFHNVVGRLAPGVSVAEGRAEVATTGAGAVASARAGAEWSAGSDWGASLVSLDEARRDAGAVRAQLVLAGAAAFVLLIALVNLSGLLLARGTGRARESAVRAALGAGRFRLARHGAVEGGLLGLLGGALGVLLALWSVGGLVALSPEGLGGGRRPRFATIASFAEPSVDWRVIAFAAVLSLAAGVLAGLIPALRGARPDLSPSLRTGARGSSVGVGTLRRPTVLSAAAVAQVALALVLLVGAGLMLQGFQRLRTVDPGFDPSGVVTFRISPPFGEYQGEAAAPLLQRMLERVEAVPGVESATVSLCTPFSQCSSTPLYLDGRPSTDPAPIVGRLYVGPDHFRTLRIPLLRGRVLTADDRAGRPRVAVINETAARRFWPDEDPIGRRVWFGGGGGFASPDSLTEIVGVVGDVLHASPGEAVGPDFYTSYLQFTWPYTTVLVRAVGDAVALVPALRQAVREVDANLPIYDVQTMRERAAESLSRERSATTALTIFAGLGLLLAALGIYGIMAYTVAQRRREIGIRLALGAAPPEILRFILSQGAVLTMAGLAIGAAASVAMTRALPALIGDIGPAEPRVLLAVAAVLLLIALLACYLPARSATRVDPLETLSAD